jgi:hypothetical protein
VITPNLGALFGPPRARFLVTNRPRSVFLERRLWQMSRSRGRSRPQRVLACRRLRTTHQSASLARLRRDRRRGESPPSRQGGGRQSALGAAPRGPPAMARLQRSDSPKPARLESGWTVRPTRAVKQRRRLRFRGDRRHGIRSGVLGDWLCPRCTTDWPMFGVAVGEGFA